MLDFTVPKEVIFTLAFESAFLTIVMLITMDLVLL